MTGQQGNIRAPVAQRRQADLHQPQAVHQFGPEPPLKRQGAQVGAAGYDQPRGQGGVVVRLGPGRAGVARRIGGGQRADAPGGQRFRQGGLQAGRQRIDGAHQTGAACRLRQAAGAHGPGAGKGARPVAEQFGGEPVRLGLRTFHGDERAGAARQVVDDAGQPFLAGAGLAVQPYRRGAARHGARVIRRAAKGRCLAQQGLRLARDRQQRGGDQVAIRRQGHIVAGARADRRDRLFRRGGDAAGQHRQGDAFRPQGGDEPGDIQPHVHHGQIAAARADMGQRAFHRGAMADLRAGGAGHVGRAAQRAAFLPRQYQPDGARRLPSGGEIVGAGHRLSRPA